MPSKGKVVYILIYVVDFIIIGTIADELASVIQQVCKTFKSRDYGNLSYFLRLEMLASPTQTTIM